jgi:hypothetical protein
VLRGAHRDPWRERRHRLVADVLVDEIGRLPQRETSTSHSSPRPASASASRLTENAMQRQRDRIDGAGDQLGAGTRGFERARERVPAEPWQ